jgi:hypothetical protein
MNLNHLSFDSLGTLTIDELDELFIDELMPLELPPRGQWLLSEAILRQWQDSGLDNVFRSAWGALRRDCFPFNDTEARPVQQHPRPYVVYQEQEPIKIGHSSGLTSDTKIAYLDCPVDFRVYGTTKAQAAKYAGYVAGAFGEEKRLTIVQDRHLQTLRDADFPTREDDRTWFWFLSFRFRIEGDYPA